MILGAAAGLSETTTFHWHIKLLKYCPHRAFIQDPRELFFHCFCSPSSPSDFFYYSRHATHGSYVVTSPFSGQKESPPKPVSINREKLEMVDLQVPRGVSEQYIVFTWRHAPRGTPPWRPKDNSPLPTSIGSKWYTFRLEPVLFGQNAR